MLSKIKTDFEKAEKDIQQGCIQEMHALLYYIAKKLQPKNYLEIGVYKGRSMAHVLKPSPQTQGYGIDTWATHAGMENSTPERVKKDLQTLGVEKLPVLFLGSSDILLPLLWLDNKLPQLFDLILVDGNHNFEVAQSDLTFCFSHLVEGGILIFHDTTSHPWLADLFSTFKKKLSNYFFLESCFEQGTSIAFKLPLCEGIFCR